MEVQVTLDSATETGEGLDPIKTAAMRKVRDLDETTFVTHGTYLAKIEDILREGVIAEDFARRIGNEKYQSNWGYDVNKKFISTMMGGGKILPWSGDVAVLIAGANLAIPGQSHFYGSEWLIKNRAAPRKFIGLGFDIEILRRPDFGAKFEEIKRIALDVWSKNPENSLPIYDLTTRRLLWPQEMSHQEIVGMLSGNKSL